MRWRPVSDLPTEIVAGMTPILSKFGITIPDRQGRVMVAIGEIIRDMNAQPIRNQKDAKRVSHKYIHKISVVLHTYGITDEKQRQKCTYEIWQFIDDLAQQVIGEEKERLK
jgi:hypothetical protein